MTTRKNIIKLLSTGSKAMPYHSAVLTCYTFDPLFFESVYLPCLRNLGITNVIVLMEATMYDALLADAAYTCHPVRLANYTLVRQENRHHGVFHPKLSLLFGAAEAALLVGSGNLTFSGMSENEEVWNVFHIKGASSPHYPLLFRAWEYAKTLCQDSSPLVRRQLTWIASLSPWLSEKPATPHASLASGETGWLLYNSPTAGIIDQMEQIIGTRPVKSVTVVAPFYDPEGQALRAIQSRFHPQGLHCVLDPDRKRIPYGLLHEEGEIEFYRYTGKNPLHAKLIQVETEHDTWLLSGSANAGNKALGVADGCYNDEVCILLHTPYAHNYLQELGLHVTLLEESERQSMMIPKPSLQVETAYTLHIHSVEDRDDQLNIHFSKAGVAGELDFYDNQAQLCFTLCVTTEKRLCLNLDFPHDGAPQWVVLTKQGKEISNRCLIVKEVCVERANPDPKRRKLSQLLNETTLRDNLSRLLDLIVFDDLPAQPTSTSSLSVSGGEAKKDKSADVEVEKDRFDVLRESKISIALHNGVRILDFLRQMLFQTKEVQSTDEELLDREGAGKYQGENRPKLQTVALSDATKMKSSVLCFLKKMEDFLIQQTKGQDYIIEKKNPEPEPRLFVHPSLNAASALCVAATIVLQLMKQYGELLTKRSDVRDRFLQCVLLYYAVYSNQVPQATDYESQKIRELLREGTLMTLTACSFFDFSLNPLGLIQAVLNATVIWKDQPEQDTLLPNWEKQLALFASPTQHPQSLKWIRSAATLLLSPHPIPLQHFTSDEPTLFVHRKGVGFIVIENLKHTASQWNYHYRYPWNEGDFSWPASAYRGYPASVFME